MSQATLLILCLFCSSIGRLQAEDLVPRLVEPLAAQVPAAQLEVCREFARKVVATIPKPGDLSPDQVEYLTASFAGLPAVFGVSADEDPELLGEKLDRILGESKETISHPETWRTKEARIRFTRQGSATLAKISAGIGARLMEGPTVVADSELIEELSASGEWKVKTGEGAQGENERMLIAKLKERGLQRIKDLDAVGQPLLSATCSCVFIQGLQHVALREWSEAETEQVVKDAMSYFRCADVLLLSGKQQTLMVLKGLVRGILSDRPLAPTDEQSGSNYRRLIARLDQISHGHVPWIASRLPAIGAALPKGFWQGVDSERTSGMPAAALAESIRRSEEASAQMALEHGLNHWCAHMIRLFKPDPSDSYSEQVVVARLTRFKEAVLSYTDQGGTLAKLATEPLPREDALGRTLRLLLVSEYGKFPLFRDGRAKAGDYDAEFAQRISGDPELRAAAETCAAWFATEIAKPQNQHEQLETDRIRRLRLMLECTWSDQQADRDANKEAFRAHLIWCDGLIKRWQETGLLRLAKTDALQRLTTPPFDEIDAAAYSLYDACLRSDPLFAGWDQPKGYATTWNDLYQAHRRFLTDAKDAEVEAARKTLAAKLKPKIGLEVVKEPLPKAGK